MLYKTYPVWLHSVYGFGAIIMGGIGGEKFAGEISFLLVSSISWILQLIFPDLFCPSLMSYLPM